MAPLYKKILVPYEGSKASENALQQAIQLVNDLLKCGSETTDPMQGIQIILLHAIEEIHIRIPSLYFSLRLIAGKPEETYEEMKNDASNVYMCSICLSLLLLALCSDTSS
ncbi:MAG: hypothetical protein WCF03_18550 [Nitrososphaeraceae archaeon]